MASTMVTPPLGLGRPSQKSKKYKLIMVQNPVRARCCGFGEKDRRPIDPPPILQLFIEKPDGSLQNANEDNSNLSLFVVQCALVSEDGKEQRSHVFNPSSATSSPTLSESIPTTGTLLSFHDPAPTRSLMGAVVSNAYQLIDQSNKAGIFFVFQDLSVRIEGRFCLKFMFMNLSAGDPLTMSTQVSDDVLSNPFTVYSAKNFPGMTDSTAISQCFAQQGIKISIRKGRRIRRIVDRTYSNNTVVDYQQKALSSISSPSTTTTTTKLTTATPTPTTITTTASSTVNNTSNTNNNNNNLNNNNNNNNNNTHNHNNTDDEEQQQQQQDDDDKQQPEQSSSSSSSNKPTYRRIDISTYLTPS